MTENQATLLLILLAAHVVLLLLLSLITLDGLGRIYNRLNRLPKPNPPS
jgi:hypothetical protein